MVFYSRQNFIGFGVNAVYLLRLFFMRLLIGGRKGGFALMNMSLNKSVSDDQKLGVRETSCGASSCR
jgi:hypothetical protein